MRAISPRILFVAIAVAAIGAPVSAQQTTYAVKTINFDLWCQEQAQLPPERCDKRLPEDEADFEAYRAKIEKFELKFLQDKERGQQLNNDIVHNDPIDKPKDIQSPPTPQQNPNSGQ